jgi:hypothetical protein
VPKCALTILGSYICMPDKTIYRAYTCNLLLSLACFSGRSPHLEFMRIKHGIKGIFGLIVVFLFWLLIRCFDIRFGTVPFL